MNEREAPVKNDHTVAINVHNEDSGNVIHLKGTESDSVQSFIDKLYAELRTQRKPDDRLRCESGGQDVFQYSNLSIEAYLRQHCSAHVWLFASGTGGA